MTTAAPLFTAAELQAVERFSRSLLATAGREPLPLLQPWSAPATSTRHETR